MRSSRRYQNVYSSDEAAVSSQGGGCSVGLLLPPLVVLIVGCLLATFALRSASASTIITYEENGIVENVDVNNPSANPQIESVIQSDTIQVNPADTSITSNGINTQELITSPTQLPSTYSGLSTIFTPEVQYWSREINTWSEEAGLDPNLVAVVMQIESCGDPMALSRSGAMGLFQVMPFHFYNSDRPYNPETNAARGLAYLQRSLEIAMGDTRLALAGYNGGIGVISRSESTWKDETLRYVYWGTGIYSDATNGNRDSSRLQEWLTAGGSSLCRQAQKRLGMSQ